MDTTTPPNLMAQLAATLKRATAPLVATRMAATADVRADVARLEAGAHLALCCGCVVNTTAAALVRPCEGHQPPPF